MEVINMAKQSDIYKKGRRVGKEWQRDYLPGGPGTDGQRDWRQGFVAGLRANSGFSASQVATLLAQSPSYLL